MPLTPFQQHVLALLAPNRTPESHLAGASGIHLSASSPRHSQDLDYFHDSERMVAEAFSSDQITLHENKLLVSVQLSQPGFIRALVSDGQKNTLLVDWAHDSSWRFMPPVLLEKAGYVLHPVDLAVNKVLALAGRDEPRDFVDVLYLHESVLPLSALCWAAAGKDGGLNPVTLVTLLERKGRYQQHDIDRLAMDLPFDLTVQVPKFREALRQASAWFQTRPPQEMGCLYRHPVSGRFFQPNPSDAASPHVGRPGGVLPATSSGSTLRTDRKLIEQLETFFERRVMES